MYMDPVIPKQNEPQSTFFPRWVFLPEERREVKTCLNQHFQRWRPAHRVWPSLWLHWASSLRLLEPHNAPKKYHNPPRIVYQNLDLFDWFQYHPGTRTFVFWTRRLEPPENRWEPKERSWGGWSESEKEPKRWKRMMKLDFHFLELR